MTNGPCTMPDSSTGQTSVPLGILLLIVIFGLSLMTTGCARQAAEPIATRQLNADGDEITFVGTWSRAFEPAPGSPHTATYIIEPDSIRYMLEGDVGNADYVMLRDAFVGNDNRYVGHTDDGLYYVLFVRDADDAGITLYKQEVDSLSDGLNLDIPPKDTTENHGWNRYASKDAG